MNIHLTLFLENIFLAIIFPITCITALSLLSKRNKELLNINFGFMAQYYLGSIGVIVHELSHAIMTIIFGHKITEFHPLINPKKHPETNRLGYVKNEWNQNSRYQNLGNLFIGISPIFGCTFFIYLVIKLTMPNCYNLIISVEHSITNLDGFGFKLLVLHANLFKNSSLHSILLSIIGLALILSTVSTGFDLSKEDLLSTKTAFIDFCIFILTISVIAPFLNFDKSLNNWLISIVTYLYLLLSVSLITGFALYFILRIYAFISLKDTELQ